MSKFEGMDKLEINIAIANSKDISWQVCALDENEIYDTNTGDIIDYCNSWADMGPIVEKHNISISPMLVMTSPVGAYEYTGEWSADIYSVDDVSLDRNPLRAAAIIYLESLEQNNA